MVCSSCYRCVVHVDFRASRKSMHRFFDDVHIVEALNEPVDDSGSEGAELFVDMGNVFCEDFFFL